MASRVSAYYARVSTNRQEQEATIESQIAEVQTRIKDDGNAFNKELSFEDNGWSGDLLARPALDLMRDAAAKKQFEVLYIWDRDRIGRKYYIQELILEELEKLGIEVIDLHGSKVESPEDKILLGFKGLFAEFEKAKIGERMRRGKLFKAKQGFYMNLSAPYGYTYVPKTKDAAGYLVVNEKEAEVVRKIFQWIADEGMTIRGVIKRLNDEHILPRKAKRDVWSNGPIARLIRNESYVGRSYYNKNYAVVPENPKSVSQYKRILKSSHRKRAKEEWILTPVPQILEDELFNRVQEQLALNKRYNPRNVKRNYLLTSIVRCVCGRRRIGESVKEHIYYRCTDRIYNFPLPQECKASGVDAAELDKKVWDKVSSLLSNPELIMQQAEKALGKAKGSKDNLNSERLAITFKKTKEEEKRYLRAYGSGLITFSQFQEQTKDLKDRQEKVELQIIEAKKREDSPVFDLSKVTDLSSRVVKMLESVGFEGKQFILRSILENVVVGDLNKVCINGYIPMNIQVQKVGLSAESRNCRFTKRGEIHAF